MFLEVGLQEYSSRKVAKAIEMPLKKFKSCQRKFGFPKINPYTLQEVERRRGRNKNWEHWNIEFLDNTQIDVWAEDIFAAREKANRLKKLLSNSTSDISRMKKSIVKRF